jgi:hypothetical protein
MRSDEDDQDSSDYPFGLRPNLTPGARVLETGPGAWRLEMPAGPQGSYRLAQLDDYGATRRADFPRCAPLHLTLRARASTGVIPGTWGFGLWNDPFGMALLSGAEALRLPVLPNAAWYFFASPPNYLSLRDDLPAQGALAATFQSPRWPAALLVLSAPVLPLFLLPSTTRLLRRLGRRFVQQDALQLQLDPTDWHTYGLIWQEGSVEFLLDGKMILKTDVSPLGPLGLVIWVDNQYAALPPNGRLRFGTLLNPEAAWIELADLALNKPLPDLEKINGA